MSVVAYPAEAPVAEIQSIIGLVRRGELLVQRARAAKDLWVVAGYLCRVSLGDPDGPPALHAWLDPGEDLLRQMLSNREAVEALERIEREASSTYEGPRAVVPWGPLAIWALRMLVHLLMFQEPIHASASSEPPAEG